MLHSKFQVSSISETYFSGTQIWPKSAVNSVLYVYRPSKRLCTLLGFNFRVMKGCFYDVFGLPYRLASLLMIYHTVNCIMCTTVNFILYITVYNVYCIVGVAKIFRFTCTLFWSIPTYSITLSRSFSEK